MRGFLFVGFVLILFQASGQKIETLDSVWWADRINPQKEDFKPFTINKSGNYIIKDEGRKWPGLEGDFFVTADLMVNGDSTAMIRESEALLRHDTLSILITQLDESVDHNFQIQIVNGVCFVFYDYSHPMDEENRILRTSEFTLTLNTAKLNRGNKVRGHVTYVGQCVSYCDDWLSNEFKISGNFVMTIR
jgi:hypothetical protein